VVLLRVHPLRGPEAVYPVPESPARLPRAALSGRGGGSPVPDSGAVRVQTAAAVAREPRRRVVCERAAQGIDRGEEGAELGPVRGGPVRVPRRWDHVSARRRPLH